MKPATTALPAPITHRQRPAGFTLVELLVTIVVLSILLGLAVPAFRSFMQNDQQWVQQQNLVLSLNTARSEAIKEDIQGGVQVCSSTDGATCTATPWEQGWIVLPSVNPFNPAAVPKPLQVVGALPTGTTLTMVPANPSVTFLSNGAANAPVAFRMCDSRGATFARYLQVTVMGRVVAAPMVGQDLTGAALVCP
ncbi:MAG TPA: GspH/FimT family pseudopilin [Steroidobacteraceae bacterium]|jgi:type IV fimbrial biogenesis protein FimT|nr:GspH/FimT family pseudopilin [Steroidobacteraceae bacterium]